MCVCVRCARAAFIVQKHSRKQSDVTLKSSAPQRAKHAGSFPRTAVNSASFAQVALIVLIVCTTRHVQLSPAAAGSAPASAHLPPAWVLYHRPPTSWLALYFHQSCTAPFGMIKLISAGRPDCCCGGYSLLLLGRRGWLGAVRHRSSSVSQYRSSRTYLVAVRPGLRAEYRSVQLAMPTADVFGRQSQVTPLASVGLQAA